MIERAMIRNALDLALVLGLSSVMSGCFGETCRDRLECFPGALMPEPSTPSCDPAAGAIDGACSAVYVSSSRGDDDSPGTPAQPVRTLGQALTIAVQGPRRVYACAEAFTEAVTIPSGVELWGGLDCTGETWAYLGELRRTVIAAEPGAIALRVVAGTGRATVADVHVDAADAVVPGGSSIAVSIASGAAVDLVRSELVAGLGAPGAAGRIGGDLPASAGEPGEPGGAACSVSVVPGGPGAINQCGDGTSIGGHGGIGGVAQGGSGTDGTPEPVPNPASSGLGGLGQTGSTTCHDGAPGAEGASGQHGSGGRGAGSFSAEGWLGVNGEDGTDGRPGQGGGGGGGARGGIMFCGASLGGASGGGGGAGGCGGRAGKGGGHGGASIGLLTLSGDVALRSSSIVARGGGDGGAGGRGQLGGSAGMHGTAGSSVGASPLACHGGDGGAGGDGGNGGGGLGGPSIAVLHQDGHLPLLDGLTMTTGPAGKGGPGGDPGLLSGAGEDGLHGDVVGFPP